jgi:type 1 glutamine amidotransferase
MNLGLRSLVLAAAVLFVTPTGPSAGPQAPSHGKPIRVLILSGQNNHDWKSTTPKLVSILKASGRFDVSVMEEPVRLTAQSLQSYDVLLSNWNAFGLDPAASEWPEEVKRAYLDFVRNGKGHVVVHAGSSSFPDWSEYHRLTLASWQIGRSAHGPIHEFPVRAEGVRHPVTAGLELFKIKDEIWNAPGLASGAEVLASSYSASDQGGTGKWEPSVLAGRFGEGRSLTILLGHDAEAMDNHGFRSLLLRAIEWAATGRVSAAKAPSTTGPWRWERQDGASLALVGPGGPLWKFLYGTGLDVPYFHPLETTNGQVLTWDRPPDHLWHHGLWFSWKFINTINYWELDAKTGRPAGKTSWSNVRISTGKDLKARIDMDLAYRPVGEDVPVLTEKRTIEVAPPDGDGVYAIDWTCAFKAAAEVILDRTPLPGEPGGQVWGGYSGLSLRLAEGLTDREPMTSDGPVASWSEDRYRGRHAAMDYSGRVGGIPVGVAILDHRGNPRSPSPWYVIRSAEMSFFTPAVICYEPLVLHAGDSFVLRYRILVHPGRWDAERLRKEAARFSGRSLPSAKE